MRNSKLGLKSLVLAIMAALGMMAFSAGAQAQTHAELLKSHAEHNASGGPLNPNPLASPPTNAAGTFLINLGSALLATVAVTQVGTGVLLVVNRSLEVRCTGLELKEGKIDSSTDALGEAVFTGCKSFDHKTLELLSSCVLKTGEKITAQALVKPILHGKLNEAKTEWLELQNFLLFEPQVEGGNFTTISYVAGMGCLLPLNNPVTGKVAALVDALDAAVQTILLSEGIQLLAGYELNFGGNKSYITAQGTVSLSGAHLKEPALKLGIH